MNQTKLILNAIEAGVRFRSSGGVTFTAGSITDVRTIISTMSAMGFRAERVELRGMWRDEQGEEVDLYYDYRQISPEAIKVKWVEAEIDGRRILIQPVEHQDRPCFLIRMVGVGARR